MPFERLVPALRERFAQGCEVPLRHSHTVAAGPDNTLTSLIMPAWVPGRCYGAKTVNIATGNARLGLAGLHSTYLLYDAVTGAPMAWMDGDQITARRTAAASALTATWLARADARHLLIVGAGQVAKLLPDAYRTVRQIERVTVWVRNDAQARAFVAELRGRGWDAHCAASLQAAAGVADIVSCATLATQPVLMGRWLPPGSHLDLIGSFTPTMREADDDCFAGAAVYVDTEEALSKSGDLLGPMSRDVFRAEDVKGTLAQLSRGQACGRGTAEQRTVFKSVGTALEDLAAAMLVHDTEREPGDPAG